MIHSLDLAEFLLAICHFKTAMAHFNQCLNAIDRLVESGNGNAAEWHKDTVGLLFDIREVWLRVMEQCRLDEKSFRDEEWSQALEVFFYEGRVQGVGFRYSVLQLAKGFEVIGQVRNLDDGRVHLVAVGQEPELREFLQEIAFEMEDYIKVATENLFIAVSRIQRFSNCIVKVEFKSVSKYFPARGIRTEDRSLA